MVSACNVKYETSFNLTVLFLARLTRYGSLAMKHSCS